MPQDLTTGPRNHLENMHLKIWVEMEAIKQAKVQIRRGIDQVLNEAMN